MVCRLCCPAGACCCSSGAQPHAGQAASPLTPGDQCRGDCSSAAPCAGGSRVGTAWSAGHGCLGRLPAQQISGAGWGVSDGPVLPVGAPTAGQPVAGALRQPGPPAAPRQRGPQAQHGQLPHRCRACPAGPAQAMARRPGRARLCSALLWRSAAGGQTRRCVLRQRCA